MRERESWHRSVSTDLGRSWGELPPELNGMRPALLCQVELALRLMERVAPKEPAEGAYALLGGYPFVRAAGLAVTDEHEVAMAATRQLLWTLRRRRTWHQCLTAYRALPERFRGYEVPPKEPARALSPAMAANRFAVYDAALAALPPYVRSELPLAPPGRSTFIERRRAASVTFPERLRPEPAVGHDLATGRPGSGAALTVTRAELAETARWMDALERENDVERPGNWERRLSELRIAPRDADGRGFTDGDSLRLDGLLHLVGMVGAGKSTLMTLIAVWAARCGLRTTLVVGDVAEQLRLSALLRDLGLPATPVLGPTTRETHVQRLHRRLASRGRANLLDHDDPGFDDLSTVCVADALRGVEAAQPLRYADAPCASLFPEQKADDPADSPEKVRLPEPYRPGRPRPDAATRERAATMDDAKGKPHGCPLWSACPRHQAARSQVDALVWVANPASLVQSAVPNHLNEERLRQLELACTRSDLVIVDEVDSVQMKLDEMFAPSATLVSPGPESWLDQLQTHKIEELSRRSRLPLTDHEIDQWNAALGVVSAATDRLYRALISDQALREWADLDYFSPWTLQEKLLADWFRERSDPNLTTGVRDEREVYEAYENDDPDPEPPIAALSARRAELTMVLDAFRDDPLGGNSPYGTLTDDLIHLTRDLLHTLSAPRTRARTQTLLEALLVDTSAPAEDEHWLELTCRRLEFTLLLSALHHRLDRLTFLWPQVEAALRLDSTGNELARRPPQDYAPIVPESPMGNVLGFQYLPDDQERDEDGRQSGTLRFFRCAGIGRELLLSLHRLGADPGPGRAGPHVVLMSGTSWAGTSTRAHVLAPVGAVLKPSERALRAVGRSQFVTRFLYDNEGKPMSLSGVEPKARPAAARALVSRLGGRGRGGTASPLEEELALIEDDSRRRALLLVGSYKEAAVAAEVLHGMERWHGRVRVLIADDADLDQSLRGTVSDGGQDVPLGTLRRGDLATFAEDSSAELLVAPLMAVERGHNILNSQRTAAFGTALFLARPHPRPDDLSLAVFAINDWAARFSRDKPRDDGREGPATFDDLVAEAGDLDQAGVDFRTMARKEWQRLLSRRYVYSRLSDWEKRSFAWDQLITMWQVIGRLVRGGVPARVVFVDARFAPELARALAPGVRAEAPPDKDGLLAALHDILTPYFSPDTDPRRFADPADPALVRLLYEPLYDALNTLTHRT